MPGVSDTTMPEAIRKKVDKMLRGLTPKHQRQLSVSTSNALDRFPVVEVRRINLSRGTSLSSSSWRTVASSMNLVFLYSFYDEDQSIMLGGWQPFLSHIVRQSSPRCLNCIAKISRLGLSANAPFPTAPHGGT